jgi:hypothetical protein
VLLSGPIDSRPRLQSASPKAQPHAAERRNETTNRSELLRPAGRVEAVVTSRADAAAADAVQVLYNCRVALALRRHLAGLEHV